MPACNTLGGLPFEWKTEQEMKVDEAQVRHMVAQRGVAGLTLAFRNVIEREGSEAVCVLPLDCTPFLLGASAVTAAWPNVAATNAEVLMANFRSVTVTLAIRQPAPSDPSSTPPIEGQPAPPLHPEETKLVPPELLKKLAPVLVTPTKVACLPDLPASQESLSNSCFPVSLWYKFVGDKIKARVHEGTPTPWEESRVPGLPAVRHVLFNSTDIILAGDMPPGHMHRLCNREVLEVRVYDRSALPEDEVKLYKPRPPRNPPPEEGAEDVKPGSGSKGRNSPKAKAGAKKEPPRPGSGKSDASAKQATPAKPTPKPKGKAKPEVVEAEEPVPEPEPVPDPEPECPVYGVARFTLHRLAAGDLNVKLKANVLPVTHMKGGAELDWKSRPGKYMESAAYMVLKVRAAVPVVPSEMEANPFSQVMVATEYKDSELYIQFRKLVRENNIAALELKGNPVHVLTSLTTYKLEPEQQQDPQLDLLTGFQLTDGKRRLVVLEGLAYGRMAEVVEIAKKAAASPATQFGPRTILYNEQFRYPMRLYGWLGADLWPLKLYKPLPDLLAVAGNMTGNRLRPECMEALKRLSKLIDQRWWRDVDRMHLLPLYPMLNALDKRFAGELTVEDLDGKPEKKRVRRAVMTEEEDPQKHKRNTDAPETTSVTSVETGTLRRRPTFKAALDMDNASYLETLKEQRLLRLERDFHFEYMDTLPDLYDTCGKQKKEEFLARNPHRGWQFMPPEMVEQLRTARLVAARKGLEPPEGHARCFQYPFPTQPHEYIQDKKKPSGARCEELEYPWVENENFKPVVESDAKNAHLFQTVFQGAKHGGRFFEPGLANYRSILAAGDAAAAEEYEDWVRDAERWRSKVVVDDLNFHAVLHSQARKVPGQTDKGQLMLQDPPMRVGISGRSKLKPCVQSIYLQEPWTGVGQWEDFNPKQTSANALQQTEPKTRPTAYLRQVRPERFLSTKLQAGSMVPQDFSQHLPKKERTDVHARKHGPIAYQEQPKKVHLHHPLPLPPPPNPGRPRPGTPPVPFGNVEYSPQRVERD